MTTNHFLRTSFARAMVAFGLTAAAGVGILVGRTSGVQTPDAPPAIEELREEPNFYMLPARRPVSPETLVKSVDAVGHVRVESVASVKEHTKQGPVAGIETSWGHVDVRAAVIETFHGDPGDLSSFAFEAVFELGTDDPAVSAANPPLRAGQEYVVFIKDGEVYYPDGTYRVYNDKVWNIGHWASPTSRVYPSDLSGLSVDAAKKALRSALLAP